MKYKQLRHTNPSPITIANEYLKSLEDMKCSYERLKSQMLEFKKNKNDKDYEDTIKKQLKKYNDEILDITAKKKLNLNSSVENICKKRRINTIIKYIHENISNNPDKEIFSEYIFSKVNMSTPISIPAESHENSILLATAIYILDSIKASNNFEEAVLYISDKHDEQLDERYEQAINDACYSKNMIIGVIDLIVNRNETKVNALLNEATVKNTPDTAFKHNFIKSSITSLSDNNEYNVACDEIVEKAKTMTKRERLDKLLCYIHPDIIKISTERFKGKIKDISNGIDVVYKVFYDDIYNLYDEIITKINHAIEKCKEIQKTWQELSKKENNSNNSFDYGIIETYGISNGSFPSKDKTVFNHPYFKLKTAYDELTSEIDEINQKNVIFGKKINMMEDVIKALHGGHIYDILCDDEINDDIKKAIKEQIPAFDILNPFETCFAYFMLIETGDDIPWLVDIPRMVISFANNKLPWKGGVSEEIFNSYTAENEKEKEKNDNVEIIDDIEKEKELYDMKYDDRMMWYLFNTEDPDESIFRKNNFAQIIYKLTGTIMPRQCSVSKREENAFEKAGFAKENLPLLKAYVTLNHQHREKMEYIPSDIQEKDDDNHVDELNKIIETQKTSIENGKTELENLKTILRDTQKQLQIEQENNQNLVQKHENEKQELNELRELVYNLQNQKGYEEEIEEQTISFPYETKKRIVIFGGHETWLKAIVPMLKNVRFIDPNSKIDANIIRYADEVWLQTNAMSHSYYNNIMAVARQQKVALHYFGYASAEKCATQLALHDAREKDM